MKKLFLLSIFILLSSCNYAYTQTVEKPKVLVEQSFIDDATKSFVEVVALRKANLDLQAENATNLDLRKKEEAYNDELLKAVALLISSEKRDRSFFEKLRYQLGRVLMNATDPKALASIVSIILILDRLKK